MKQSSAFLRRFGKRRCQMNLKGRDFLTLLDYSPREIEELLNLAQKLKAEKKKGIAHEQHKGKTIALIFEKPSTRTRCSFEVAAFDLGMHTTYLDPQGSQLGQKESIADTARVLSAIYQGIEYRGFGQKVVEELARFAHVPVWNGLTNEDHPTQVLADLLTLKEHFGSLKGLKLVFMGDCRYNMARALAIGAAKMGLNFTLCGPRKYLPDERLLHTCKTVAKSTGALIQLETDPNKAAHGADGVYTDVWLSMGEEKAAWQKRIEDLRPYQVNAGVMAQCKNTGVFMHCLPAFHNTKTQIGSQVGEAFGLKALEVTEEVFESPRSIVFKQAENRMHTIKAVMAATL